MSQPAAQPAFQDTGQFDEWADRQPGRWELHDGQAVHMAAERAIHSRVKANVYFALRRAFEAGGLPCEAMVDGPSVPGPGLRRFRPDVLAICGRRPGDQDLLVDDPVILVEVLSPSTGDVDGGIKLASYIGLASLQHYLLISTTARSIVHHRRWDGESFLASIATNRPIELSPPGVSITADEIYAGTELQP